MDIKIPYQAGGNSASGLTQVRMEPGRTKPGASGHKTDGPKEAATENVKMSGQKTEQEQGKTVFAVDADNKVVIQVLDPKGKVLRQIPQEEFGTVARELNAFMKQNKNLFSREA
ncbi:MAG: flagellar protein FlaG [Nitrospiraceae bacterium]|nr:flagellar protein FlaG [Nitrospiraceae bacterium]